MKKVLLAASLAIGSTSFANSNYSYELYGCDVSCDEVISSGNFNELIALGQLERQLGYGELKGMKKKKGKSGGVGTVVSYFTGVAKDAVNAGIEGMKTAATDAGFTEFKCEMRGPKKNMEVWMNLRTGEYRATAAGGGSGQSHAAKTQNP